MTGMTFIKASSIFIVQKYSGKSKNDRNEVDKSNIHNFFRKYSGECKNDQNDVQ